MVTDVLPTATRVLTETYFKHWYFLRFKTVLQQKISQQSRTFNKFEVLLSLPRNAASFLRWRVSPFNDASSHLLIILLAQNKDVSLKLGDTEAKFSYETKKHTRNLVIEVSDQTRKLLLDRRVKHFNMESGQ